jgi:hypothetical protein
VPEVALVPLHWSLEDAVQEVASVALQAKVSVSPRVILSDPATPLTVNDTVGGVLATTVRGREAVPKTL